MSLYRMSTASSQILELKDFMKQLTNSSGGRRPQDKPIFSHKTIAKHCSYLFLANITTNEFIPSISFALPA